MKVELSVFAGVKLVVRFEWDIQKAAKNVEKHGISFQEAATVFDDPIATIFDDPKHSAVEDRKILVGLSNTSRILLISYTERGDAVRIISARKANQRERNRHETHRQSK